MDRKEKQAYRKMQKRHTRVLIKLAKEDRDFDWGYLHELVITKIKHMYEYFSNGNNVCQTDETRVPICIQLNHILQLQEEIDHLQYDMEPTLIEENEDGSVNVIRTKESAAKVQELWQKESELYKEIYKFIGEHIEEWWD